MTKVNKYYQNVKLELPDESKVLNFEIYVIFSKQTFKMQ